MVNSWAPEPPEDRDDHLPVLSSEQLIFPQSEDSDDMPDHPDPPSGYTLFPNSNLEEDLSNDESDDDSTSGQEPNTSQNNEENTLNSQSENGSPQSQILPLRRRNSEVAEVSSLYNGPHPSDIVIDCEEVRAAMASITLPPSAFPPWAVGISDSELTNQIQRLLNKSTPANSNSCLSTETENV